MSARENEAIVREALEALGPHSYTRLYEDAQTALGALMAELEQAKSREDFLTEQLERQTGNASRELLRAEAAEARLAAADKLAAATREFFDVLYEDNVGLEFTAASTAGEDAEDALDHIEDALAAYEQAANAATLASPDESATAVSTARPDCRVEESGPASADEERTP